MPDGPPKTPGRDTAKREIYIEFIVQGAYVKATAIDAASGVEASIVGPATAPRESLSAVAVRKLEYVLRQNKGGA